MPTRSNTAPTDPKNVLTIANRRKMRNSTNKCTFKLVGKTLKVKSRSRKPFTTEGGRTKDPKAATIN